MRVVSGVLGGRRIEVPTGDFTRPTTDRVREAIFNALYSLDVIDGARVLDLFAGSGAMGIEALSRGAESATFVESDSRARSVLRDNIEVLELEDRSTVVAGDGPSHLSRSADYDLLLLDPPYDFDGWEELLKGVAPSLVVIESGREIEVPARWEVHRARRYGSTVVTLATAVAPTEE